MHKAVVSLNTGLEDPETVTVAAHYLSNGRNIYARVTQEPDGPYEINVADVGAEDWKAALARDCRVRIPSLHFDLEATGFNLAEIDLAIATVAGNGGEAPPRLPRRPRA